jgi:hypothetical protein
MNLLEIIENNGCNFDCVTCRYNKIQTYFGCGLASVSLLEDETSRDDKSTHVIKGARILLFRENIQEILK